MDSDEGRSGLRLKEEHPLAQGHALGLALPSTETRLPLPETRRNLGLGQRPFGRYWQAYATGRPVPGWGALGPAGNAAAGAHLGVMPGVGCIPDRERLRVSPRVQTHTHSLRLGPLWPWIGPPCLPASPPLQPPCLPASLPGWRAGRLVWKGGCGGSDLPEHGAHVSRLAPPLRASSRTLAPLPSWPSSCGLVPGLPVTGREQRLLRVGGSRVRPRGGLGTRGRPVRLPPRPTESEPGNLGCPPPGYCTPGRTGTGQHLCFSGTACGARRQPPPLTLPAPPGLSEASV